MNRKPITGQCEYCGKDYEVPETKLNEDATVTCPHCKKKSYNWD